MDAFKKYFFSKIRANKFKKVFMFLSGIYLIFIDSNFGFNHLNPFSINFIHLAILIRITNSQVWHLIKTHSIYRRNVIKKEKTQKQETLRRNFCNNCNIILNINY